MIYDLVSASIVEEKKDKYEDSSLRARAIFDPPPPDVNDWASVQRQGLGLVQACRQVREEYLPIYSAHHRQYISLQKLVWYINALNKSKKQEQPVLLSGGVRVGVRSWLYSGDWRESSINIRSLLCAYKEYPDFNILFDLPYPASKHSVYLFSVRNNGTWWNLLQDRVLEVNIWGQEYYGSPPSKAEIVVRSGEPWMVCRSKGKRSQMAGWLANTAGLSELERWNGMRVYIG